MKAAPQKVKLSTIMSIRISPEDAEKLKAAAEERDWSMSFTALKFIRQGLAQKEAPKPGPSKTTPKRKTSKAA